MPFGFADATLDAYAGNIIAMYKMEDAVANVIVDSSPNGLDGTNIGTTDIAGKSGRARDFNGTSDWINLGSPAALDTLWTGGGTFSVWIDPDTGGGTEPIILSSWGSPGWYAAITDISGNDAKIRMYKYFSGTDGEWRTTARITDLFVGFHLFTLTYNEDAPANDPIFYIDGSPVASTEIVLPIGTATVVTENTRLGDLSGVNHADWGYEGIMDEIYFWNTIISSAAVTQLGAEKFYQELGGPIIGPIQTGRIIGGE